MSGGRSNLPTVVEKAAAAVRERAGGVLERIADRFALPQLYQRYRKNALTHGVEFLRGDPEIDVFVAGSNVLSKWRPIPGPNTASLSRASVAMGEEGTAVLRGHYGGARGEVALLDGAAIDEKALPVGAGKCGMGSIGHWKWDFSQHHWLEVSVRTDGRPYELVLQVTQELVQRSYIYRALIPQMKRKLHPLTRCLPR